MTTSVTVLNIELVGKGVLRATASVDLGNGIVFHEIRVIDNDGDLIVQPPQRQWREKGGQRKYADLIEVHDADLWKLVVDAVLKTYRAAV